MVIVSLRFQPGRSNELPMNGTTPSPLAATRTQTLKAPVSTTRTDTTPSVESTCQVVLHNDDHNAAEFVVLCLMKVFAHSQELAVKIMMEAHTRGRSIAEVEAETPALKHRDQLRGHGLSATVEKVE